MATHPTKKVLVIHYGLEHGRDCDCETCNPELHEDEDAKSTDA